MNTVNEDGTMSSGIDERQRRKRNPILDPADKFLSNPNNKAPAASFIQNEKKKQQRLQKLLDSM